MDSKEKYVEIASGHITRRGTAVKKSLLSAYIDKKDAKHELYHSWYSFDHEMAHYIKVNKTIVGFKGVHFVDSIVLDIDKKDLEDDALLDYVRYFVNTELLSDLAIQEEHIQVWFSGTGFHVELANVFGFTASTTLPSLVRNTLEKVFPDCDSIYDGPRLIRAPFSYNKKSGLFKVPLTISELNDWDMMRILAEASSIPDKIDLSKYTMPQPSEHYLQQYLMFSSNVIKNEQSTKRSNFDIDPTSVVTCMQTVLSKPPVMGERNDSMMRLAAWLRRSGVPKPIVYDTLNKWSGNSKEAKSTTDSEFENGYNYWCDDQIMSKYCDPKCIHFKRKDYSLAIEDTKTLANKFVDMMKDGVSKKAFNFATYYNCPDFWVMPGELVILLGDTGMGKSTFLSNLTAMLKNHKIMYLSLENSWHLTYGRFCQIVHSKTQDEIKNYHMEMDDVEDLYSAFNHIQFGHVSPDIEKLKEAVAYQKPDIVCVDTTDEVVVKSNGGEIERMNTIIGSLKEIATQFDCIVIAVHHVNKQAAMEGIVTLHSAKGSTNVVQKADKVLSINGSATEMQRSLYCEKNRNGNRIKIMFKFNKPLMKFEEDNIPVISS